MPRIGSWIKTTLRDYLDLSLSTLEEVYRSRDSIISHGKKSSIPRNCSKTISREPQNFKQTTQARFEHIAYHAAQMTLKEAREDDRLGRLPGFGGGSKLLSGNSLIPRW